MWTCPVCHQTITEPGFTTCWNCGHCPKLDAAELERQRAEREAIEERRRTLATCLRCEVRMEYVGTRRFHEGTRWGALGDLGELFVDREEYDVMLCPACGKLEFYLPGVGQGPREVLGDGPEQPSAGWRGDG